MKKVLAAILSCAMLLGTTAALPAAAEASAIGWTAHGETDLRVGILADTHMRNADTTSDIVNHILDSQKEIAGEQMDGMALVGDIVFYNSTDDCTDRRHYANMYASIQERFPDTPILYAMGNHEFPFGIYDDETSAKAHAAFKAGSGQELNAHTTFGGDGNEYHFVSISPKSATSELTAETKAWAMQEIENAIGADSANATKNGDGSYSFEEGVVPDSTKPVFLLCHAPLPGTVTNGTEGGNVTEFVSYLKTRPQVVMISGHRHPPAVDPYTIWQDGFTAFCSSINDGAPIEDHLLNGKATDSSLHQGAMLEVEDNVVKIYKLDYVTNEEIGEPWVIDIPQIVSNLRDDDPSNDNNAYLYCSENRSKVQSEAEFPEGTELTAAPGKNDVVLTYPNTATVTKSDSVQQDNFVRGYRIEILNEKGTAIIRQSHMSDYYVLPQNRMTSYSKAVYGLSSGSTYTARVYPILPLGTYGTPIETTFKTKGTAKTSNSRRYEIEDYCTIEKLNVASEQASGEGLCISAQAGGVTNQTLGRYELEGSDAATENAVPFYINFEIDLPVEDEYNVSYAASYLKSSFVSKVTFSVDGTKIGDNSQTGDTSYSNDSTYPWSEIPLHLYKASTTKLSAGKHTVTVQIDPTASKKNSGGGAQPFLFCADFIEFTPKTPSISLSDVERIELENYASAVSIEENDGTPGTATVGKSAVCSEGAFLSIDTADNTAVNNTASFVVPINVEHAGDYLMEYVDAAGISAVNFFIDSEESTALNASGFSVTLNDETYEYTYAKDGVEQVQTRYSYFNSAWAKANTHSGKVKLPEGKHNLIVSITKRSGFEDFASYLDYVQFTPYTKYIAAEDETTIEFETYQSLFAPRTPTLAANDLASGLTYVNTTGSGTETITLDIPIMVEKAGGYQIDACIAAAGHLSVISLMKGDKTLYTFSTTNAASGAGTWDTHFSMKNYLFALNLEEGVQTLTFSIAPREGYGGTVAYAMDYIRFKPVDVLNVDEAESTATATAIYDDPVSGTAILALYNGAQLISTSMEEVSETMRIDISAQTRGEEVTSAKLIVLDSLEKCIPKCEAKDDFFISVK